MVFLEKLYSLLNIELVTVVGTLILPCIVLQVCGELYVLVWKSSRKAFNVKWDGETVSDFGLILGIIPPLSLLSFSSFLRIALLLDGFVYALYSMKDGRVVWDVQFCWNLSDTEIDDFFWWHDPFKSFL